jgi:hypothetical protein
VPCGGGRFEDVFLGFALAVLLAVFGLAGGRFDAMLFVLFDATLLAPFPTADFDELALFALFVGPGRCCCCCCCCRAAALRGHVQSWVHGGDLNIHRT